MYINKKIGLVLSGGGARGLFAVRILELMKLSAFDFSQITAISGVSVGSIIGAMLVQGDLDILIQMFKDIRNKDVYSGKISLASIAWNAIRGKNYVLDVEPLRDLLWKYIDLEKAQKSKIPFEIGVVDMTTGKYRTFNQRAFNSNEQYIRCIMASCSQPVIWKPQYFSTRFETIEAGVDGGVITVSPIKSVLQYEPDELIIMNSSPCDIERVENINRLDKTLLRTVDLAVGQSFIKDMETFQRYNTIASNPEWKDNAFGWKYYPATIYQTTLHEDSLDFDSEELKKMRINNADEAFNQIQK